MKSLLDYCGCSAAAGRELEARKLPRCSSYFAALPIKKSEERHHPRHSQEVVPSVY